MGEDTLSQDKWTGGGTMCKGEKSFSTRGEDSEKRVALDVKRKMRKRRGWRIYFLDRRDKKENHKRRKTVNSGKAIATKRLHSLHG